MDNNESLQPDINARVGHLEERLSKIEKAIDFIVEDLQKKTAPAVASQPKPPPAAIPQKVQPAPLAVKSPRIGESTWIGLVSGLCFLLAAGFIVKLAIDSGWLTPPRQIVLSLLLGVTLIGAGIFLTRFDRAYATFLPGAGIAILYLSILAAHSYHHLIAMTPALGFIAIITAFCIGIYLQIRHDAFLLIAALGSYIAPLILGANSAAGADATAAASSFILYYYVACSIGFAAISMWLDSRFMAFTAASVAMSATAVLGLSLNQDASVAAALAFQFVIFVSATAYHSVRTREALSQTEAWAFFPALLIFYAGEYFFIYRLAPDVAPWISLGFAGFLYAIYFAAAKQIQNFSSDAGDVCLAFVSIVLFHSLYLEILTDDIRPWLFVLIAGAFAFAPFKVPSRSSPVVIPLFALVAVLVIEYFRILAHLQTPSDPSLAPSLNWQVVGFAGVAAMCTLYTRRGSDFKNLDQSYLQGLLGATHLLAIFSIYRLLEPVGSLFVSGGWLAYALSVIVVGFKKRDALLAKSALMVLALASAKALLYDAAAAPTGLRIVCLLLTGAVLYLCGLILRRIAEFDELSNSDRGTVQPK